MTKLAHILRPGRAVLASALIAFAPAAFANHSLDVPQGSVFAKSTSVTFTGITTQAGAVGPNFTSMVCTLDGNPVGVGNSHTYASVGEQFTFTVPIPANTFATGDSFRIALSDTSTAACNNGSNGFDSASGTYTPVVGSTPVPTLSEYALMLLALALAVLAMRRLPARRR